MSAFVRIFVDNECVHERELRPGRAGLADLLLAMEECPPPKANGCAVYIAGALRRGTEQASALVKVAQSGLDAGNQTGLLVPLPVAWRGFRA